MHKFRYFVERFQCLACAGCGRCNVGSRYVCKDGTVFRCSELTQLPQEL